jgi:S-adenosylmethionine decarboxylase
MALSRMPFNKGQYLLMLSRRNAYMKDLAPGIVRQRLLVEGFFSMKVNKQVIRRFFAGITDELSLNTYGYPAIHATGGAGNKINQGFDAFMPLVDSGIALYVWSSSRFFSAVIYTCKRFDNKMAVKFIKKFFKARKIEYKTF